MVSAPNGLELSCPAEAGNSPSLYGKPPGKTSGPEGPARRVSFSELLGGTGAKCPGMEVLCKQHIDGRITEPAVVSPGVIS